MRPYEFRAGEADNGVVIVDLDSIVMFQKTPYEGGTLWTVTFGAASIDMTKAAFDRILAAWKSK